MKRRSRRARAQEEGAVLDQNADADVVEAAGADAEGQVPARGGDHFQEPVLYAVRSVTEPVHVLSGICHKLER